MEILIGVMARANHKHGRASASTIDIDAYCPGELLSLGGPLFGDLQDIQDTLDAFLSARLVDDRFAHPKCTACGFPNCSCNACELVVRPGSTKPKGKHTCALKHCHLRGASPPAGHYDVEMQGQLLLAWQTIGINQAPVFNKGKKLSGYFWPEELELE